MKYDRNGQIKSICNWPFFKQSVDFEDTDEYFNKLLQIYDLKENEDKFLGPTAAVICSDGYCRHDYSFNPDDHDLSSRFDRLPDAFFFDKPE